MTPHLKEIYADRHSSYLRPLAERLQTLLMQHLEGEPRIDRIVARAKDVDSFIEKAKKQVAGQQKYDDPLNQIQDQVGARIVTYYLDDIARVEETILRYFRHIEQKDVVPESEWTFGYFGKHFILFVPNELLDRPVAADKYPRFFELQIKTLFQHAWGEANHDLGYKPAWEWGSTDDLRRIAFVSAQAWGADMVFNELFRASGSGNDHPHSIKIRRY